MTKKKYECNLCTCNTGRVYKCGHYVCHVCKRDYNKKKECFICGIDSSKFKKIRDLIRPKNGKIKVEEKMVVFTQWKNMARLLGKYLKKRRIKYCMITGDVSLNQRNELIEKFKTDKSKIMIATIQTCGVGINLTRANHVVLLDSWWNASLEKQAIDRLYRIGQDRKVSVYNITIKQTIERWINFKQRQKKIQSQILFENKNEEYKRIGQSYGIYQEKKGTGILRKNRFYSEKRMSRLSMNSCLDREREYTFKISPNIWAIRNGSARIIQRFYKNYIQSHNVMIKQVLMDIYPTIAEEICGLVADYSYVNRDKFRKDFQI